MTQFDSKGKFTDERRKRIQALSNQGLEDLLLEAAYYSADEVEFVREELKARKNALKDKSADDKLTVIPSFIVEEPQPSAIEINNIHPDESAPVQSEINSSTLSEADAVPITTFSSTPVSSSPASPIEPGEQQIASGGNVYAPSSYASGNYAALRGIASFCTFLGWAIFILAGLISLIGLQTILISPFASLLWIIVCVAVGGIGFIIFRIIAESISVLLDIEANTRRAAVILEQRLK
jgi:hypothetical protein